MVGVMCINVRFIVPLFLIALVLAGAGCLGTKTIPVNQTAPPAILIDYHRSGGINGANDRLVIFTNGVAAVSVGSSNTELRLNDSDLALLSVLFNESDFSQLQANYPAPYQSPGLMTYTISYGGKTVTAQDTDIPPSLETLIDKLNTLLAGASPQKSSYPTFSLTS